MVPSPVIGDREINRGSITALRICCPAIFNNFFILINYPRSPPCFHRYHPRGGDTYHALESSKPDCGQSDFLVTVKQTASIHPPTPGYAVCKTVIPRPVGQCAESIFILFEKSE